MQAQNVQAMEVEMHPFLDLSKTAPLPADFIKIGCCAIRCSNFELEQCFGCKTVTQCLCIEEAGYWLRCSKADNYCFVFGSGAYECVYPALVCNIYRQFFCCEFVLGCPVENAYFDNEMKITNGAARASKANAADIVPCSACCCQFQSCYCKWPECCGMYGKVVQCCIEREMVMYKPACCMKNNTKPNLLCMVAQGNCLLVEWKTCCKEDSQTCCLSSRCALPCDEDVPCLWMPLPFCVCCVNGQCYCGCCQNLEVIRNLGRPPVPPPQVTAPPPNVY